MAADKRFLSLRYKIAGAVAGLTLAVSVFLFLFFPSQMDKAAQTWADSRLTGMGLVLQTTLKTPVEFDDSDAAEKQLAGLDELPDALYGVVRRQDGTVFGAWRKTREEGTKKVPVLEKLPVLKADWDQGHEIVEQGGALHFVAGVIAEDALGSEVRTTLAIGLSMSQLEAAKRQSLVVGGIVCLIVLGAGLSLAWGIGSVLVRPIRALTDLSSRVVTDGDLTASVEITSRDEVQELGVSFREMVARLRSVILRVKSIVTKIAEVGDKLSSAGEVVNTGAQGIEKRVAATSNSMGAMRDTLDQVTKSVDILHQNAGNVSASIIAMARTNEEVAGSVQQMAITVDETSSAINRVASVSVDIAAKIRELDDAVGETSSSMAEMHATINEVEQNTAETARLADKATNDTSQGVAALEKTTDGIRKIEESSKIVSTVIQNLAEQIASVSNMVNVINDVAEQTNLLALNAAIIAAQAGEHGRGFSVVADEIKSLADRTRSSTSEITTIIRAVEEESLQATHAMEVGAERVAEGVELARGASDALAAIAESTRAAKVMADAIALATVEQSQGTRQISEAVERIAATMQEIRSSSSDQAQSAETVMKSTTSMNDFTQRVRTSSREQAEGSTRVITSVERIDEMVREVSEAQTLQAGSADEVANAMESIKDISQKQVTSVDDLEGAIDSLQQQAGELQVELGRFRV